MRPELVRQIAQAQHDLVRLERGPEIGSGGGHSARIAAPVASHVQDRPVAVYLVYRGVLGTHPELLCNRGPQPLPVVRLAPAVVELYADDGRAPTQDLHEGRSPERLHRMVEVEARLDALAPYPRLPFLARHADAPDGGGCVVPPLDSEQSWYSLRHRAPRTDKGRENERAQPHQRLPGKQWQHRSELIRRRVSDR